MSDDIDKLIERALQLTEEDAEAGHSVLAWEADDVEFHVHHLRAVAKAARRELARELLTCMRAALRDANLDYETAFDVTEDRLREIAEEEA